MRRSRPPHRPAFIRPSFGGWFVAALLLASVLLLPPVAGQAQAPPGPDSQAPASELESELTKQKETASQRRRTVERLTAEERTLNAGLSALEAKVGKLT
ncbi:MAG: hypothetical protein GYA47_08570 [Desulfovibrio sp.]|nr:hypothetical protein [Desulfovibrio sp.]